MVCTAGAQDIHLQANYQRKTTMSKTKTDFPQLEELISFRGRTAPITGAASGFDKAASHRFAEAWANLH
jgi:hypothetical protein